MKRPKKADYLTTNQFTYDERLWEFYEALEKYCKALEKYCDWLEEPKEYIEKWDKTKGHISAEDYVNLENAEGYASVENLINSSTKRPAKVKTTSITSHGVSPVPPKIKPPSKTTLH